MQEGEEDKRDCGLNYCKIAETSGRIELKGREGLGLRARWAIGCQTFTPNEVRGYPSLRSGCSILQVNRAASFDSAQDLLS